MKEWPVKSPVPQGWRPFPRTPFPHRRTHGFFFRSLLRFPVQIALVFVFLLILSPSWNLQTVFDDPPPAYAQDGDDNWWEGFSLRGIPREVTDLIVDQDQLLAATPGCIYRWSESPGQWKEWSAKSMSRLAHFQDHLYGLSGNGVYR